MPWPNLKISLMWRYFIQFASGYFADYNDVSAFERAPVNDKNLQARKKQSFPFLESYLDKCLSMRFHWCEVGCVFPMVGSILPHAIVGPNDNLEEALHFIFMI